VIELTLVPERPRRRAHRRPAGGVSDWDAAGLGPASSGRRAVRRAIGRPVGSRSPRRRRTPAVSTRVPAADASSLSAPDAQRPAVSCRDGAARRSSRPRRR
jgi:hypothetical protein